MVCFSHQTQLFLQSLQLTQGSDGLPGRVLFSYKLEATLRRLKLQYLVYNRPSMFFSYWGREGAKNL